MISEQGLFSFHDFCGYLFPGMFCALSFYFIFNTPCSLEDQSFHILADCQKSIIAIVICYLLGHLLSFLSSITIEKYSIWTLGYPSSYLFNKKIYGFFEVVCRKKRNTIKHEIRKIRNINIDKIKTQKKDDIRLKKDKRKIFRKAKSQCFWRIIIKLIVCVLLFPIVLFDINTRYFFYLSDQYARRFSKELISILENKYTAFLKDQFPIHDNIFDPSLIDKNYFKLVSHFAMNNLSDYHCKMINRYKSIYLFIRTTTFVSIITFWSIFLKIAFDKTIIFSMILLWYYIALVVSAIICFLLYLDFNKFYRKYSVEIILSLSSCNNKKSNAAAVVTPEGGDLSSLARH